MIRSLSIGSLVCLALITACQKNDIVEAVTGQRPACGSEGSRVEATINGSEWCGDALVHAVRQDSSVMVTAANLNTSNFSFSIDQAAVGTTPIQGDLNGVLYLENGITYIVAESSIGQLTISDFDSTTGRVRGELAVQLQSISGQQQRTVHLTFDVTAQVQPG